MNQRFTIDGSGEFEKALAEICAEVRAGALKVFAARDVHTLVLGGGYGRGEGGVLRTSDGDRPYNDMEFYVLMNRSDLLVRRERIAMHDLSEGLSERAGIEVEFKLLPVRKLQRSPVTMFYYDLVSGHRLIEGSDSWTTECEHHRAAHRIPLHEATRLLMNRCSGLLFAQERLSRAEFADRDRDFVGRNLAKAQLGYGDVALTMRGQYHWSCRERHKRLKKLAAEGSKEELSLLADLHERGVEFKLHPIRTMRDKAELQAELEFLKDIGSRLWLSLENHRLEKSFASIASYCADDQPKCPETNSGKNRLINARTFGFTGFGDSRYPRERLLRSLPLLLWEPKLEIHLPRLNCELRTSAQEFSGLVQAYAKIWSVYN